MKTITLIEKQYLKYFGTTLETDAILYWYGFKMGCLQIWEGQLLYKYTNHDKKVNEKKKYTD